MVLSHTPMATPLLAFPSDPPPDWTPSPRDSTLCPRELFPLPTTTARGPLMLRLIPTTLEDTLLPVSLLDIHLARTPSPRALMPPPRDTFPTDTSDTTTARGLLTLRLIPTTSVVTLSPTPPTALLLPLSPSDPPPAWTPSPRALTPPPRGTLPTPTATSATTTVKFRELTRHVC